jgi:hypothetical protein
MMKMTEAPTLNQIDDRKQLIPWQMRGSVARHYRISQPYPGETLEIPFGCSGVSFRSLDIKNPSIGLIRGRLTVRATGFVAEVAASPCGKPPCPGLAGWRGRQPLLLMHSQYGDMVYRLQAAF